MAAVSKSNQVEARQADGKRAVEVDVTAIAVGDTVTLRTQLGLTRVDRVLLDVTDLVDFANGVGTFNAVVAAGTLRFEGT